MAAEMKNARKRDLGRRLTSVSKQQNHITPQLPEDHAHNPTCRQRLKRLLVCSVCRGLLPISWAEWLYACMGRRHE